MGECWFHNTQQIAYWEGCRTADGGEGCRTADGGFKTNADGYTSHLPMVMDFALTDAISEAFVQNENLGYDDGIKRVYGSVSLDFAYYNPYNLLTFITNHDMERPAIRFGTYKDSGETVLARMKNATTLLLTMRGVPQWYYGDEILMHGPEEMVGKGDAWWRTDARRQGQCLHVRRQDRAAERDVRPHPHPDAVEEDLRGRDQGQADALHAFRRSGERLRVLPLHP